MVSMKKLYQVPFEGRIRHATSWSILNAKASKEISEYHNLPVEPHIEAMASVDLSTAVPILVEDDAFAPKPVAA
jgi:hypothetical protein